MVIKVPPKFWWPKVQNKYIPLYYANDLDEYLFDFGQYGKAVLRPQQT